MEGFPNAKRRIRKTLDHIHRQAQPRKLRIPIPFHKYLIEQKENYESRIAETQCDSFEPRKLPGNYIPPKQGFDASTQADLDQIFSFDHDVKPILQNIVAKTLEQSLMEVRQEEVLKSLENEKIGFAGKEKQRSSKAGERLAGDVRKRKEKEERKKKGKLKMLRIKEVIKKAEAWAQLGKLAHGVENGCHLQLERLHLGESKLELIIKNRIMPYLYKQTNENIQRVVACDKLAESLLGSAVLRLEQRIENAREQMKKLRIRLRLDDKEIGPFVMEPNSKISDLTNQILNYLNAEESKKGVKETDIEIFSQSPETLLNPEDLVNSSASRNLVVHLKSPEVTNEDIPPGKDSEE